MPTAGEKHVHNVHMVVSVRQHEAVRGRSGGRCQAKQISRCILRTACSKRPVYGMKLDVIDGKD